MAPREVVVLIGTNNLFANDLPCAIAAGVEEILQRLRSIWPRAQILLIGVPPIGVNFNFKDSARRELNALLADVSKPAAALYISLDEPVSCGFQSPCGYYLSDGIHFSEDGYGVIGNILAAAIKEKH